ncbi:MAG: UDP-N-acetylmuramoyl-L-alanine--D-glutamate ligase [Pseudomonadota bacterium]|nr:UDP-N-acetylmuramoyl-L-alanine--D-glutamate ligase [Pseudomonadota bacterium]
MFAATCFKDRKVAVFGLGRSGSACVEALRLGGAEVVAWDDAESSRAKAKAAGVVLGDFDQLDLGGFSALVLSPGVPLTHPEPHWTVRKATAAGIEVIGDTEVFQRQIAGTGARLVAITGTNGKSTTTALIGHLFKSAGRDVEVGGNIGKAVFLLAAPKAERIYVLELSSFQIDLMPSLAPDAGVLLNLSPDHLERHGTMAGYAAVKARMFARQGPQQTAIIGVDDPWGEAIAAATGQTRVVRISVERTLDDGVCATAGILRERTAAADRATIDLRPMRALKGTHNWQNACAAFAAARSVDLTLSEIERGMASFPGLAHRMEEVGHIGRMLFINDSKATNADAAAKALASFDGIYWIAGGIPKAGGIEPLREFFPRIVKSYLIGQAADAFAHTIAGAHPVEICGTLDRAVAAAVRDATPAGGKGAVILLSPACSSFDHYPNFEVRGDAFRKLVAAVPGVETGWGMRGPC